MTELSIPKLELLGKALKVYLKAVMLQEALPGNQVPPDEIRDESMRAIAMMEDITILVERKKIMNSYKD